MPEPPNISRVAASRSPARAGAPLGTIASHVFLTSSLILASTTNGQSPELSERAADKSSFTLFNPTPRELMRDMSTDRPDTTESPYTVDAGHFQVEVSFVDFSYDRNNEDSQTARSLSVSPTLLKIGLLNNVDLQVGIDPYTRERTIDRATDASETISGFGDTIARMKVNLWGNDGGETAFAIMPFVKFPTADTDLGNGNVEGGFV